MNGGAFSDQFAGKDEVSSLTNFQAEIGFLVDLIADNRLIDPAADRLRPGDFASPLHGQVFARLLEQSAAGNRVDAVTLAPFLRDEEGWDSLYRVLSGAEFSGGPRDRTKAYLEAISSLSSRRRVVAGLQDVIASVRVLDNSRETLIADADEIVGTLAEEHADQRQAPAAEYARLVIDSFGRPIVGVRCGTIGCVDDLVGTLRPGDLKYVGGRPGMGKTSYVTSYAIGAASRGHATIVFSLEMTADQLTRRILADMCCEPAGGILYSKIRDGTVNPHEMPVVLDAQARLDALPIEINEQSGLTIAQLTRKVRTHKRRLRARGQTLELVIVDYLQRMGYSRKGISAYEHVSEVSRSLKELAKSEGVVVMAAAQLSREVEKRNDKRPIAADLRDSGQIEQDADVILFLYREEEYLRLTEPTDQFGPKYETWRTEIDAVRDKVEFLAAKVRTGEKGKAVGWFLGKYAAVRGSDFYSARGGTIG